MKEKPFPHISIPNFVENEALVRAAAESFEQLDSWVEYGDGENDGQIQYCSELGRKNYPPAALAVLDYICENFDPNDYFVEQLKCFPDHEFYGGGMMNTPNRNDEGGYLGMHVDASHHGINKNWVRCYSAILCISEDYDESFDLHLFDGESSRGKLKYEFNTLNVFRCSANSWHGLPEITKGLDRKALGVVYWRTSENDDTPMIKAKFYNQMELFE
tara:strand:- start:4844 stop:5491 length:648 start_codon:yes stop_codon:yes gene_type:complete